MVVGKHGEFEREVRREDEYFSEHENFRSFETRQFQEHDK
jgi:hypothetical protein